jgi:hypothetical protein
MSPEEWNTGVNNEAEHVEHAAQAADKDPAWASEARDFVKQQTWQRHLVAFGCGLAIMQAVLIVQVLKAPLMVKLMQSTGSPQIAGFVTNLTDVPLLVGAFYAAWLLGRRRYRAWPVAVAFALFQIVKIGTQFWLEPLHNAGLSIFFDVYVVGRPNALTPQAVLLWVILGVTGYYGVTFGARTQQPKPRVV